MEDKNILVSVVVVIYNAEKYIEDALNSVKNQTYSNIELIITDDCSKDDTFCICERWLQKNQSRFTNTIIVQTSCNSGVVVNLNMGCRQVNGSWVKLLAGDDLLPQKCIEEYVSHVISKNVKMICCSHSRSFAEVNDLRIFLDDKPDPYTKKVFNMPANKQYKKMLIEYVILLPGTAFISKELYNRVGLYDEDFPDIEDQPFFLKIAQAGIKIEFADEILGYLHRTGIDSISQTTMGLMNANAFKINGKLHRQDQKYILPNIPKYHIVFYFHYYWDLLRRYIVIDKMKNKDSKINRLINKSFLLFDPIFMRKKIYNCIHQKGSK